MPDPATIAPLSSCLCTQAQLSSPLFQSWAEKFGEPGRLHRKVWEWTYIAAALEQHGMLAPGKRGLGFAVGKEPLPSMFASRGCEIVATDLPHGQAAAKNWIATKQHSASLDHLNERGLCPTAEFRDRVTFEPCDMNRIPEHLTGFDFTWSACSLEHLGSISLGERFIYQSLASLRQGGIAVHTTEYNTSSNTDTVDYRSTVIFRQQDIERIARTLEAAGHRVAPLDLAEGELPNDKIVDIPPYSEDIHLKLLLKSFVCTSVGLIIEKRSDIIPEAPRYATRRTLKDRIRPFGRKLENAIKRAGRKSGTRD